MCSSDLCVLDSLFPKYPLLGSNILPVMISFKKLIKMVGKRLNLCTIKRKRSVATKNTKMWTERVVVHWSRIRANSWSTQLIKASWGPLLCVNIDIFRELLNSSEEDLGQPRDRPLTLPCDAIILKYIFTLGKDQREFCLCQMLSVTTHYHLYLLWS